MVFRQTLPWFSWDTDDALIPACVELFLFCFVLVWFLFFKAIIKTMNYDFLYTFVSVQ